MLASAYKIAHLRTLGQTHPARLGYDSSVSRICNECGALLYEDNRFCPSCGAEVPTPSQAPKDPLLGRTVGDAYVLSELIGIGGMGRVYRADQRALGRSVAVKLIHPHLLGDDRTVARFYTEARASSRLNHPNSVSIIDFGREEDGTLYLVMEYLEGHDLAMMMQEPLSMPLEQICEIVNGILGALGEAHAHKVVHRDLKPENIILKQSHSGRELVKVVDFGLATITEKKDTSITAPGLVCGTPDYMAPEQGQGLEIDGRSDLYAVGVLLYELIVGEVPFDGETPTQVILQHISAPIPDPRKTAPTRGLNDKLAEVVIRALQKKPEERFQNAEEMRTALEEAVEDLRRRTGDRITCPHCGMKNDTEMRFCGGCGSQLPRRSTSSSPPVPRRQSHFPAASDAVRPLVGRTKELTQIEAVRADKDSGMRWLNLHGDSGIGKTRILREVFMRSSAARDISIWGAPHASRAPVAYRCVLNVVLAILELDQDELATQLASNDLTQNGLERSGFFEMLEARGLPGRPGQSRAMAVAAAFACALRRAVTDAGGDTAFLIVADDLDNWDPLSLEVLREVRGIDRELPVFLLSSSSQSQYGAINLEITGLDHKDAELFLAGCAIASVDEPLRLPDEGRRFWNPLHLEQLHALGDPTAAHTIADAVMQRIDRLGAEARRTLQAICVLGDRTSASDVDKLTAAEGSTLDERRELLEYTIDRLEKHQFIRRENSEVVVAHPFLRDLVVASIPAEAKRSLHQRALEITTAAGAPASVRAIHAALGAESTTALVLLERAGDVATQSGDTKTAAHAYRTGLELGRKATLETGDPMLEHSMIQFSRKLGEATLAQGDATTADGVLREALDLAGPNSEERHRMWLILMRIALARGKLAEARRLAEQLQSLSSLKPLLKAELCELLGLLLTAENKGDKSLSWFREAAHLRAEYDKDPARQVRTLLLLARSQLTHGDQEHLDLTLEQARSLAKESGSLTLLADIEGIEGELAKAARRAQQARDHWAQAVQYATDAGNVEAARRWEKMLRSTQTRA